MADVQLDQRRVEQAPLPGVRVGAAPTPNTFGASIAAVGENVGLALYAKARREADETAVLDADTKLARQSMDIQTNMQQNYLGKEASRAPEFIEQSFGKAIAEASQDLSDDHQRELFQRRAQHRQLALMEIAQHHMVAEGAKYQNQVTNDTLSASVDNARLQASTNPDYEGIVNTEKGSQAQALGYWAQRNGIPLDSPLYKQRVMEQMSKTNTEVIKGLLYNGKTTQAKEYYQQNKDEFVATDRDTIEKTLEESGDRMVAQTKSREFIASGADRGQALRAVEKIDDPKQQELTRNLIKTHFDDAEVSLKRNKDQLYETAGNIIDKAAKQSPGTPIVAREQVPPDVWMTLSLAEKAALQHYADFTTKEIDQPNDDRTWLTFYTGTSPEDIAKMSPREFQSDVWQHLDKAHKHQAETYYTTIRNAYEKKDLADPKLTEVLSARDQVSETFRTSGLVNASVERAKWSAADEIAFSRFITQAQTAINEFEVTKLDGKRKASPDERQAIINKVKDDALKKVWKPGLFWDSSMEKIRMEEDDKGRAYVPVDKIPKIELDDLRNYIQSLNKPITLDKLRRAYPQWKYFQNRAAFDAIVNE